MAIDESGSVNGAVGSSPSEAPSPEVWTVGIQVLQSPRGAPPRNLCRLGPGEHLPVGPHPR
jgi:hypothetical protein